MLLFSLLFIPFCRPRLPCGIICLLPEGHPFTYVTVLVIDSAHFLYLKMSLLRCFSADCQFFSQHLEDVPPLCSNMSVFSGCFQGVLIITSERFDCQLCQCCVLYGTCAWGLLSFLNLWVVFLSSFFQCGLCPPPPLSPPVTDSGYLEVVPQL